MYRENLNKGKILYPYEKITLIAREDVLLEEEGNGVFTIDRNDRLYRRRIHCANSTAGPTSFYIFNETRLHLIFDFRNTPPWGPVSLSVLA